MFSAVGTDVQGLALIHPKIKVSLFHVVPEITISTASVLYIVLLVVPSLVSRKALAPEQTVWPYTAGFSACM